MQAALAVAREEKEQEGGLDEFYNDVEDLNFARYTPDPEQLALEE